ncbi:MAG TPA: SGNH/GDSL hydrolase family protein [Anaeromyxobacter sp.]
MRTRHVLALLALLALPLVAEAQSFPYKLSNAGDSLSQGFAADGFLPADEPWNSWVQGVNPSVDSIFLRLRRRNPFLLLQPESRSGAAMIRDFADQAARICAQRWRPNRVYVFLGQNDVCSSARSATADAAASLPSVDELLAGARAGLDRLALCLPRGSVVQVVSMVRVDFLYDAGLAKNLFYCPAVWQAFDICRIVTAEQDPGRRARIGERVDAWNGALAAEVRAYDANANGRNARLLRFVSDWEGSIAEGRRDTSVGSHEFGPGDIDALDCFHASLAGQRKIACVEWAKSPDGSGSAPACFQ